jgi:hypothetical protein
MTDMLVVVALYLCMHFEANYRLVFVRPALPVPRPGRDREAQR